MDIDNDEMILKMWLYCTSVHANDIKCVSLLNLPLITAGGGKGWSLNAL